MIERVKIPIVDDSSSEPLFGIAQTQTEKLDRLLNEGYQVVYANILKRDGVNYEIVVLHYAGRVRV